MLLAHRHSMTNDVYLDDSGKVVRSAGIHRLNEKLQVFPWSGGGDEPENACVLPRTDDVASVWWGGRGGIGGWNELVEAL